MPYPYPLYPLLLPLATGSPYPPLLPTLSVAYLFNLRGSSTPLKYATQIAALAPALNKQYKNVLLYKCPPYPLHPGGNVVLGYHLTEKCNERLSPIVTLAFLV